MNKMRRIGTLTSGIALVALGCVFLANTIFPGRVDLELALSFWPVIIILLGIELLAFSLSKRENDGLRIDFASVVLMFLSAGFAFCCEAVRLYLRSR